MDSQLGVYPSSWPAMFGPTGPVRTLGSALLVRSLASLGCRPTGRRRTKCGRQLYKHKLQRNGHQYIHDPYWSDKLDSHGGWGELDYDVSFDEFDEDI